MAVDEAAAESARGRLINPVDLPTPDNLKSYITSCIKRYQQAHSIPEDSIKISETDCTPAAGGSRSTGDAYHQHSCGLSHPYCKKLEDYQMQIMLLEHQNKRRLMMARNEANAASSVPKQPTATPRPDEIKFRYLKLQDHQRELMGEALPGKQEQPTRSAPEHSGFVAPPTSERQNVKEHVPKNLSLEYQKQNEQAMRNLSLEEYQKQLLALGCGNARRNRYDYELAASRSAAGPTDELRVATAKAHDQGAGWDRTPAKPAAMPTDEPRVATAKAHDQGAGWDRTPAKPAAMPTSEPQVLARAPMTTLPMMAHADYLKKRQNGSALEDYNMQLMLLEQQNRKRLMMARHEQDQVVGESGAPGQIGRDSKPKNEQNVTAVPARQEKPALDGTSKAQESEQILEMGSALGAQKGHEKRNISEVVHTDSDSESDMAVWSTDDFDEWSNCEDDMETIKKL